MLASGYLCRHETLNKHQSVYSQQDKLFQQSCFLTKTVHAKTNNSSSSGSQSLLYFTPQGQNATSVSMFFLVLWFCTRSSYTKTQIQSDRTVLLFCSVFVYHLDKSLSAPILSCIHKANSCMLVKSYPIDLSVVSYLHFFFSI